MIFALGALVAGLAALLTLPAFRRRAERLAARRVALTMPLSMDEVIAERDQIRAEAAVAQRRIEQKAEALLEQRVADMTELGRRATRIVEIEGALSQSQSRGQALAAALATATREREEAWGERAGLGKALYDADGRADREHGLRRDLERRHADLDRLAQDRQAQIDDLRAQLLAAQAQHDALLEMLVAARATQDRLEADIAAAHAADARTREDNAVLRAAIADLGERLLRLDAPSLAQTEAATRVNAAQ